MINKNRDLTDKIIEYIKYFSYKPESVSPFLQSRKKEIEKLPISMLLEIEKAVEDLKNENKLK